MRDVIAWLISVERTASRFYKDASHVFKDNNKFSDFLEDLAEDEAWHYHVMGIAAEYARKKNLTSAAISIDEHIIEKVLSPFLTNSRLIASGDITEKDVTNCVIDSEFSEWNHIFLYVVNTLKREGREFMYAASKIQRHLSDIEKFIELLNIDDIYLERIKRLPRIWKKRILVIEDESPIAELLSVVLSEEGNVETVGNGRSGLEKVVEHFYDAIISNIDMPVMDGIEFYKNAIDLDPDIRRRIVFFSSFRKKEYIDFVRDNGLASLEKPVPLDDIRKAVRRLLLNAPIRV